MKIINTAITDPDGVDDRGKPLLTKWEKDQVYNGLDCAITAEVFHVLQPQLDGHTQATYEFAKCLQAPVLEMRLRGVRIDGARKAEVIDEYIHKLDLFEEALGKIVLKATGTFNFNWRSPQQLAELFYDHLRIPPIRRRGHITVDRAALEQLELYPLAWPVVVHLKAMRDLAKKISVLQTEADPDGRMRTSYNIAGTSTGRFSSSFSEFGTGTNFQNLEEALRSIFIADPGMKMGYADAQQGESRVVGGIEWNLFGDPLYLDSCERGDLHTNVAKLVWPNLGWSGNPRADRKLAERPYYRHYDRRFMCKKIGHGSNYGGKPRTLAAQSKVDIELIEEFQPRYFTAFPAHQRWHLNVADRLSESRALIGLTGRKRYFLGSREDPATLREAIAFDPQGSLADILNHGMLNVWRANDVQLLMQVHDAILFQFPEEREDELVPKVLDQLRWPVGLARGRDLVIPYECKTGWNFGNFSGSNPDGLKEYSTQDQRRRTPEVDIMDRPIR